MKDDDDDDEVGFQRTEQLRQLYESLSAAAETNQYEPQPRKPSAALSPEDLSDVEWYFLVCMTYEFSEGQGKDAWEDSCHQTNGSPRQSCQQEDICIVFRCCLPILIETVLKKSLLLARS